jgi:hypothetical protein
MLSDSSDTCARAGHGGGAVREALESVVPCVPPVSFAATVGDAVPGIPHRLPPRNAGSTLAKRARSLRWNPGCDNVNERASPI